ncbi:MAG: NUDIX domain-containing protein [SAR202 cluster bacterium]|nr:NUDIX domain-containing protein [SAR202 cluster bacterium]
MEDPRFCAHCGAPLARAQGRPSCQRCGRVSYLDPKLAAAAMVTVDGRLLLVRRAIEPAIGKWSFPSGYVDRGEVVEAAVAREVREETGLEVAVNWLVGLYSRAGNAVVLAVYDVRVRGGEMHPGVEAMELGLFDPGSLPDLAFEHDMAIVEDWLRTRTSRTRR